MLFGKKFFFFKPFQTQFNITNNQILYSTDVHNQSGFDQTMKTESKMGPVYDGENIVFYHKDFSNCIFWNENLRTANWNKKVKESLTESADYKYGKDRPKEQDFWNKEMQRKNEVMFSDKQKVNLSLKAPFY